MEDVRRLSVARCFQLGLKMVDIAGLLILFYATSQIDYLDSAPAEKSSSTLTSSKCPPPL